MKQAKSASDAARSLMSEQKKPAAGGDTVDTSKFEQRIKELEAELKREVKDKEALKSQAESLNREYDRLTDEYSKLQNKVESAAGNKSD